MNSESVRSVSQSAGNPRRYQLTPPPSEAWLRHLDRCWAHRSSAVRRSLPEVLVRAVASDHLEALGVTPENSLLVDAAVRELSAQANHGQLLDEINRRQPVG